MFEFITAILIVYALFWTCYLVVLPTIARLRSSDTALTPEAQRKSPRIAVVIPAHNMSRTIERCVRSLLECDYTTSLVEIFVVADHCDDDTREVAERAGAIVLERNEGAAGKTYALAWAWQALDARGVQPDLYVVVDATATVAGGFLTALAERYVQAEDIVVGHAIVDPANERWFARCMA